MLLHQAEKVDLAVVPQKCAVGRIEDGRIGHTSGVPLQERSSQVQSELASQRGHLGKASFAQRRGPFLGPLQVIAMEPQFRQQEQVGAGLLGSGGEIARPSQIDLRLAGGNVHLS